MTEKKRFQIPPLPPAMQLALGAALKEVGRVGAKAIAAGVKSVAVDVRKAVREADEYLQSVEEKAGEKSKGDEK
jgi:hypothetical protein